VNPPWLKMVEFIVGQTLDVPDPIGVAVAPPNPERIRWSFR
jgi:hypothetical protein